MFTVVRDGVTTRLHDDVQLAAYLTSGWVLAGSTAEPSLEALRAEAESLGIRVAHNAGIDSIKKRIAEFKASRGDDEPSQEESVNIFEDD